MTTALQFDKKVEYLKKILNKYLIPTDVEENIVKYTTSLEGYSTPPSQEIEVSQTILHAPKRITKTKELQNTQSALSYHHPQPPHPPT